MSKQKQPNLRFKSDPWLPFIHGHWQCLPSITGFHPDSSVYSNLDLSKMKCHLPSRKLKHTYKINTFEKPCRRSKIIFLKDILSPSRNTNNPMNCPLMLWPHSKHIHCSQDVPNSVFNCAMHLWTPEHKNVQKLKTKIHTIPLSVHISTLLFHVISCTKTVEKVSCTWGRGKYHMSVVFP